MSDFDWITDMDSREFLQELHKMLQANVNCEFAYADHDENEEFEILSDMVLEHLTKLDDKAYNKLNGRA